MHPLPNQLQQEETRVGYAHTAALSSLQRDGRLTPAAAWMGLEDVCAAISQSQARSRDVPHPHRSRESRFEVPRAGGVRLCLRCLEIV